MSIQKLGWSIWSAALLVMAMMGVVAAHRDDKPHVLLVVFLILVIREFIKP